MNKTFFYCAVFVLGTACFDFSLFGADENTASNRLRSITDPIIVTAKGIAAPVSATPGGIGVLEGDVLRQSEGISISDFLSTVPGVSKTADGAWGSDVNIRGLTRDSVILLIDGARVNTSTDIGARFGLVDPLEVARVEILKGPISSLYGSGSVGGVVNIITRSGEFTDEARCGGGFSSMYSDNPQGYNSFGFASLNTPSTYYYVSQTWRDHQSYKDGAGREVHNTQFMDSESKLRFGQKIGEHDVFTANIQYFEGRDIGVPGGGTAPLPSAADVTYEAAERGLFSVAYTTTPNGRYFRKSSLDLYYQYIERRVNIDHFPASSPIFAVKPEGRHDTYGSKWINIADIGKHEVSTGLDVWQRIYDGTRNKYLKNGKVTQDKPLPDSRFTSSGVFAEDDWKLLKTFWINAGARLDAINVRNDSTTVWPENTSNDNSWNAHLGGTWKMTDKLSMKMVGASGYRVASLEERFQVLDLGGGITKYGNPDINPERSMFFEYGVNWTGDELFLGASVFVNRLDDLIGERIVDNTRIINANINEATIHGMEAECRYQLVYHVMVYGNICYIVGEDTGSNEYLPGIAPINGLTGIYYGTGTGPWARIETLFAAKQDKVPDNVNKSAGWATVDARIGWNFKGQMVDQSIYVGVNNLFDKNYRNYLTTYRGNEFNEPGRSVFAGYEIMF
ncbi:MAG: TonB-dependent receptor [Kiritimatiellae bacterium]|nr:TonB-dependent receptor [Kiritimatiellia bacterium]MDD5523340.1 TonB-dependent receptor [Kiritimatiellia bacterium]